MAAFSFLPKGSGAVDQVPTPRQGCSRRQLISAIRQQGIEPCRGHRAPRLTVRTNHRLDRVQHLIQHSRYPRPIGGEGGIITPDAR